jgi:prephenate dehydratase
MAKESINSKVVSTRVKLDTYIKILNEVKDNQMSVSDVVLLKIENSYIDSKPKEITKEVVKHSLTAKQKKDLENYKKILSFKKVGDCTKFIRTLNSNNLPKKC